TFEYRERGRKARRRGSRVFKRYPNPEAVFSQMLRDLGLSVIKLLGARRQAQDRTQETPGYQKGEEVALRIGSSLRWKKALEDWGQ
ncbi:MAG: hypothetical protein ABWY92_21570, partial [Xanthobacteraceae bacterium]